MDSAQSERAYFEFGQLIQVNRLCLGIFLIDQLQAVC